MRTSSIAIAPLVLAGLSMRFALPTETTPPERGQLEVGGLTREYLLHTPPGGAHGAPLIIALHGGGGSPDRLRTFIGEPLERAADARGFVVVYPAGVEGGWNDCRAAAPYVANRRGIDDVAFLRALVADLAARRGVDASRVYALGLSNGGHLALRLAIEVPDLVGAAAVFAASLPDPAAFDCQPARTPPSAVLLVNGTADPLSPWQGGMSRGPDGSELGRVLSATATAAWLRERAGYGDAPAFERHAPAPDAKGLRVEETHWSGAGRPEIVQVTVHGGGHAVPGPDVALPEAVVGPVAREYDGIRASFDFFVRQPQGRRP